MFADIQLVQFRIRQNSSFNMQIKSNPKPHRVVLGRNKIQRRCYMPSNSNRRLGKCLMGGLSSFVADLFLHHASDLVDLGGVGSSMAKLGCTSARVVEIHSNGWILHKAYRGL
ncbi:hypothetical protein TorRG33x02_071180 [Trema orientale]|uniref:Uncharacterized protein n=1 Tax=Trema orientale TaxID=63057 RepID=A0A2P5FH11_TREOI|nr:hypothetical protein TorRG33x02_071180 [Trema orientale]